MSYNIRATLTHLRLPFSLFLAPVYFFALSRVTAFDGISATWCFLILHLLLFPASNAYNSFYDKDKGSIGLIERPPPVSNLLLYTAILMDLVAIGLSLAIGLGWFFTTYLFLYGLASKAYSHPSIRLKKYPIVSLVVVVFFQGFYTFLACYQVLADQPLAVVLSAHSTLLPALLCSLNLLAIYPITQVYQHEEDRAHGDLTYSRLVGIQGTFVHAAACFCVSFAGFGYLFLSEERPIHWLLYAVVMIPSMTFFLSWWYSVHRNPDKADYRNTMRMNVLASAGLNLFFILLCLMQR